MYFILNNMTLGATISRYGWKINRRIKIKKRKNTNYCEKVLISVIVLAHKNIG
jgi:hypothetical protein